MNAVFPCLRQSLGLTKREAALRRKNWQQRMSAGISDVSQPLDLDETILVPATVVPLQLRLNF
jgi:hypothetical protein